MSYAGNFALETTFDFKFTTRQFSDGVPTTLAGTPVVDIYEDNSITQITGAETLTVDFDGVTGLHNLRVACTAANGFATDSSYSAVITTGTVGGTSVVGEVICNFTIEKGAALRPTTSGNTLDVTATGAAGIDWGNIENQTTAVDLSATDIQLCDTVTTNTDMRGTDNAALASVLGALTDVAAAGDPTTVDTVMQYLKQLINTLEGAAGIPVFPAEAAPGNAVSLAEAIRAIYNDTVGLAGAAMRGTDSALLAASAPTNFGDLSITATTGLVDITQAAADKVWSTTARTLTALGFAFAAGDFGAASLNGKGDWNIGKTGYALSAAGVDAIWDETMAGHVAADSAGLVLNDWQDGGRLDLLLDAIPTTAMRGTDNALLAADINLTGGALDVVTAVTNRVTANTDQIAGVAAAATGLSLSADTILGLGTASGTPTTTTMVSDIGITVDDQLNGRIIIFADDTTTAALRDQATDITACTAATNTLTFTALTTAPVAGDTFVIV